ncbi:MAG: hypothetical protein Q8K63_15895 [Acidimicrobiales bacterium]|nr:hypothetical protein [Acidimicrobiales bacterium]
MLDAHARLTALCDDVDEEFDWPDCDEFDGNWVYDLRTLEPLTRRVVDALRRVLRIHTPTTTGTAETRRCAACNAAWPCPTIVEADRA